MEERIPLIDGDPDSINYYVELNFTELLNYPDKTALEKVKKELNKQFFNIEKKEFSADPLVNFKSMIIDLSRAYRAEGLALKKEYGEMSYMLNYELIKYSKIIYNENDLLIIQLETYIYEGGAHGLGNKSFLHFNMKTGHIFTLNDLFKKDFETDINQIIQSRFEEKKQENDFFVFQDAEPTINENFYFDNNTFYFLYNPYEVAPYSSGYITIEIPLKKLEKWINRSGPISSIL
ncbi:MAG: DUF3298 and DUF4163 domain-containing protein [Chloroflexia bacterium]|nr:DUF3298 and DUF4163 domain-containing protein [Chloroflexia bacterium]